MDYDFTKTSNKTRTRFCNSLPKDIIFAIFVRLPIRDLCQCRFVCRDWYKFINNPSFVNFHHSQINDNDPRFIMFWHPGRRNLYLVDDELKAHKSCFPLPMEETEMVGSSHGLMCLSNSKSFYICNPITRETLELPKPKPKETTSVSGFAFDETTNMYKVVHTWSFKNMEKEGVGIEICTHGSGVGSGVWRRVDDIRGFYNSQTQTSHLFVNGALHWKVYREDDSEDCIAALDIETEEHTTFTAPVKAFGARVRTVTAVGEFLCLADDVFDHVVLWFMEDYGVDSSWTKAYSIRKRIIGSSLLTVCLKIVGGMENDTVLVLGGRHKGFYSLGIDEFERVQIYGIPLRCLNRLNVFLHVGSLISPKSIAGTGDCSKSYPRGRSETLSY